MVAHRIVQLVRIEPVMSGEPSQQSRRTPLDRLQLPERNTNNGTRQTIGAHPILWQSLSRGDRFDYAPLDVDKLRVAVASQKLLESRVVLRLERALMTESIPNWMRRIEMSARNPSHR
jgi:hypothetical protein